VQTGNEIFSTADKARIKEARKTHPNGSDRGMALSAETMVFIEGF
jgi:hypothetical protein